MITKRPVRSCQASRFSAGTAPVSDGQRTNPGNHADRRTLTLEWGAATEPPMIETDTLLVKCPNCGAWPMAAGPNAPYSHQDVRLRCAKCGHGEDGRLRRSASVEHPPQQPHAA